MVLLTNYFIFCLDSATDFFYSWSWQLSAINKTSLTSQNKIILNKVIFRLLRSIKEIYKICFADNTANLTMDFTKTTKHIL